MLEERKRVVAALLLQTEYLLVHLTPVLAHGVGVFAYDFGAYLGTERGDFGELGAQVVKLGQHGIERICGKDPEGKVSLLLDHTDCPGSVADPWYTGNFDETWDDVVRGCTALLKKLK